MTEIGRMEKWWENYLKGKVNITINGVVEKVAIELAVHGLDRGRKGGRNFFLQSMM
jgi:hypothetical protein